MVNLSDFILFRKAFKNGTELSYYWYITIEI